jgi:O-antigen/teichoic acid export membrane protein
MSHGQRFISGLSWNTLTVVLQVVIQLLYTGLFARMVEPQAFALMGVVLSIMGLAEIFSQIGIGPALIQRQQVDQGHLNSAFYTSILLGLAFTLLFVAAAPAIAAAYGLPELKPIIQMVSTSFTISALSVVPRSLMMKEMRFRSFFIASMFSIVGGNLIVGLVLAYLDWQVWAYVWALFAQNALMALAFWWFQPTRITRSWKKADTTDLVRYGTGSTLFNALNYAATKVDVTLLPLCLPTTAGMDSRLRPAAMYERAAYIMSLPITVMGKLSDNVLFAGMARLQEDHDRLRRLMLAGTNMLAIVIVPFSVVLFFFAHEIIVLWLGNNYADAAPMLRAMAAAIGFRTLSRMGDALLRAKNAVFRGTWIKAIYLVLMTAGVLIGAKYSAEAVAWSISLSTCIHYIMNLYLSRRLIGLTLKKQMIVLVPGFTIGIIAFIGAWFTKAVLLFTPAGPLLQLLVGAIGVVAAVAMACYLWPAIMGAPDIHPLQFLPDKIKRIKPIQQMIRRAGGEV